MRRDKLLRFVAADCIFCGALPFGNVRGLARPPPGRLSDVPTELGPYPWLVSCQPRLCPGGPSRLKCPELGRGILTLLSNSINPQSARCYITYCSQKDFVATAPL